MKQILLAAAICGLIAGGAMAQDVPPPPPPPPPPQVGDAGPPPPPPPPLAAGVYAPPPPPRDRHMPPPSKAAHFRLQQGDRMIDVKCADDEPMRACADITLQLLDRVQQPPAR